MKYVQMDFYLGSDLGLWVLQKIAPEIIAHIFTFDGQIAKYAEKIGKCVYRKNANNVDFSPSQTGFSIHYPRILKPHLITRYHKIYNLHPGYLPWGRGFYPIFWALWEQTPAGATLHEITAGIDEGPIVEQYRVDYDASDTGESLFLKVREAEKSLFTRYYDKMVHGESIPTSPQTGTGTYHTKQDFFDMKQQSHWEAMTGKDLLRLIQCLTFSGYTGLEVSRGEKTFSVVFEQLRTRIIGE